MYYDDIDNEVCDYDLETERTLAKQRAMLLLFMSSFGFNR